MHPKFEVRFFGFRRFFERFFGFTPKFGAVLRFWYLFASGFSVFDQFLCGFSVLKVACSSRYRRKKLHGFSVRGPFFHRFFGFFAAICLISF